MQLSSGLAGCHLLTTGLLLGGLDGCAAPPGASPGAAAPVTVAAPGGPVTPIDRANAGEQGAPAPASATEGPGAEAARVTSDAVTDENAIRHEFSAYYSPELLLRADDWKQAHGARGGAKEAECWDLGERVGVPPAPGMLCLTRIKDPAETVARVYRLEGARLRRVWQGTIGTWANWLELVPLLSADGRTLVVHDRAPGSCEAALSEHHEKQGSGVAGNFGAVLRRGCAGLGTHVYEDGHYVQVRVVEPPAPGRR